MPLNLDFKTSDAVAPVVGAVRGAGLTGDVVVSGCRMECFATMAGATNEIATLLNVDDLPAGIDPVEAGAVVRRSLDAAGTLGAAGINLDHSLVDAAVVARAREAGLGVWVFIVDDEDRFPELIDMGVTAATTEWPARMIAVGGRRPSTATKETDE